MHHPENGRGRNGRAAFFTDPAPTLTRYGEYSARYGLVIVLLWIGAMKFTAYEAAGIQAFVANSPAFSWMNAIMSERGVSGLIGFAEIGTAALIAARPVSAFAAMIGGALATGTFLGTLSFLLTTPGVIEPSLGFPGLSVVPGQFLLKDAVLIGVSLWIFGEAWTKVRAADAPHAGKEVAGH